MRHQGLPTILLWAFGCMIGPVSAAGELTVIFDNGRTQPLAPFSSPLRHSTDRGGKPRPPNKVNLGAADLEQLLPIESPGLTPGKILRRKHDIPFARPFFMVGSDAVSQQWLTDHRQYLITMGAVGLLVEAATIEDLKRMAGIADGLSLAPASGSDIAKALGVAHYPVALSRGYVWQ